MNTIVKTFLRVSSIFEAFAPELIENVEIVYTTWIVISEVVSNLQQHNSVLPVATWSLSTLTCEDVTLFTVLTLVIRVNVMT